METLKDCDAWEEGVWLSATFRFAHVGAVHNCIKLYRHGYDLLGPSLASKTLQNNYVSKDIERPPPTPNMLSKTTQIHPYRHRHLSGLISFGSVGLAYAFAGTSTILAGGIPSWEKQSELVVLEAAAG